ncbi:MAG: 30S ribosomal protein S3 [Candidatus Pacearchaeota archaeon]
MIEKKVIKAKKDEFAIKEFVKEEIGKGKISSIKIERMPIGEKIIIKTSKPGLVIGKRGESIQDLTNILKKKFNLENPKLEITEIERPEFDAQSVADEIALALERFGSNSFKIIAYKVMEKIKKAGALGCEIILSGKLPSEKARTWCFSFGYLMRSGESAKLVDRARAVAQTKPGVIGIKVSILPPNVKIPDKIEV